mgnify:FL=1
MFAKIKSPTFIDALQLECSGIAGNFFKAVIKDDTGSICSSLERKLSQVTEKITWSGLNDLPYGRYTLELTQGDNEVKLPLVKRV